MPLYKCKKNQYTNYFITGGPWNTTMDLDALRLEIADTVRNYYGANHVLNLHVSLEVSENDYNHFHCAVQLDKPKRWPKLASILITMIRRWPLHPEELRKPNVGFYYCQMGTNDPFKVMTDYIHHPVKDKEIDANTLEFSISDKWWIDSLGNCRPGIRCSLAYWHDINQQFRNESDRVPFDLTACSAIDKQ